MKLAAKSRSKMKAGVRFGLVTLTKIVETHTLQTKNGTNTMHVWEVKCDCGLSRPIRACNLYSLRKSTTCNCEFLLDTTPLGPATPLYENRVLRQCRKCHCTLPATRYFRCVKCTSHMAGFSHYSAEDWGYASGASFKEKHNFKISELAIIGGS